MSDFPDILWSLAGWFGLSHGDNEPRGTPQLPDDYSRKSISDTYQGPVATEVLGSRDLMRATPKLRIFQDKEQAPGREYFYEGTPTDFAQDAFAGVRSRPVGIPSFPILWCWDSSASFSD